MTTETKEPETSETEHQPAPSPAENPRNAIIKDIAARAFEQHKADAEESSSVPSVDDEHNITPAAPAEVLSEPAASTPSEEPAGNEPSSEASAGAPPEEAIDPAKDYEVTVEGQKLLVKGATIIDAGKRTLQKEAAADHKLRLASQLLEEAERRAAATPTGAAPAQQEAPKGKTEEQLAHALQFGTPEESANAVRELRAGGLSEEQIVRMTEDRARLVAADEFEFRRGQAMLAREYKDIMEKPPLRRLFESEDSRLLQAGDRRPYIERYRAIGEQLRKDFGLSKPAPAGEKPNGSAAARQVAKAKAPSVPRTAAARLGESSGDAGKPIQPSDVIAGMAAARGKNKLSTPPPKRS